MVILNKLVVVVVGLYQSTVPTNKYPALPFDLVLIVA